MLKRYVILGTEEAISGDMVAREPDLFTAEISVDGPISLKKLTRKAVHEMERRIILKVLQHHHWNRKQAARALSISYAPCSIKFATQDCHRAATSHFPLRRLLAPKCSSPSKTHGITS